MGLIVVNDELISHIILFRPRQWFLRWDVFPFVTCYSLGFYFASQNQTLTNGISFKTVGLIALPLIFCLQLFLFLLCQWSAYIRCVIGNTQVDDINQASLLLVKAARNAGKDCILPIMTNINSNMVKENPALDVIGQKYMISTYSIEFQKVIYDYNPQDKSFQRLQYPTSGHVKSFLSWNGYSNIQSVQTGLLKWNYNEFDIPIPNFLDLYIDHIIAPFFLFQVICLFLWSLDDYWYYSAFTLLMLLFFEGMMCKQRQASLTMLRNMRRPPIELLVYRCNQWAVLLSDEIVPGDIISLTSVQDGAKRGNKRQQPVDFNMIPCDALLLRGSCVVNEAMLTGESVPQMKENLGESDDKNTAYLELSSENSNTGSLWRRYTLYSGTTMLLHTAETDNDNTSSTNKSAIPNPPNGGCIAVVIRTGFGTSQGGLMRKILFATERVTGSSLETFYFIGVLVIFAIIASGAVLYGGLYDEKRNKFRLVLHCIMIITSVVPPELPMELSLSVTNSLAALARGLVYCTEPYRISFAGKLDILCFDKTGTLTKDKMILRGVVAPVSKTLFSIGSSIGIGSEDANDKITINSKSKNVNSLQLDSPYVDVIAATDAPEIVLSIMGSCHDLMVSRNNNNPNYEADPIGDPLELATMLNSGFKFNSNNNTARSTSSSTTFSQSLVNRELGIQVKIKHKFPFSSTLKRMSVIVDINRFAESGDANTSISSTKRTIPSTSSTASECYVFTKGAPEIISSYLKEMPSFYESTYFYHMSRGKRVLAIACKKLPVHTGSSQSSDLKGKSRSEFECDLEFVGFLVYDCELKADTKSVIRELKSSNHRVIMITGDSVYTAADVARKISLLTTKNNSSNNESTGSNNKSVDANNCYVLHYVNNDNNDSKRKSSTDSIFVWRKIDEANNMSTAVLNTDVPFHVKDLKSFAPSCSGLCLTGASLFSLESHYKSEYSSILKSISPHVSIFARVSPTQKESIVIALNDAGLFTLMCGDGTNDVGALKAAHVGVSIVNNPEFEQKIEDGKDSMMANSNQSSAGEAMTKKPKGASAKERMARAMLEMQEQDLDPTVVKLGDASIASPFTSRRTSIDSVLTVMRQGRCTLVTTIQVYKILALNCLVSAYMMSALYLKGLKQGDTQMTASGLIVAGLFFFLSQAKPIQQIATARPPSSVFALSVSLSILGQFAIHFSCLLATLALCDKYMTEDDMTLTPDGKFHPNVVNSAVFLLSAVMQVNNFVVNYRGNPFTQALTENLMLWRCVQILYGVLLIVVGGQLEPLNDLLQLAPFPSTEFQTTLVGILVFNFVASYLLEKGCQRFE
eukprot:gene9601-12930_t